MALLDIERNDRCVCGSGKKYKKCCMDEVEKARSVILQHLTSTYEATPALSEAALAGALVCGMEPGEDHVVLDPDLTAKQIYRALGFLIDDSSREQARHYLSVFYDLVLTHPGFQALRLHHRHLREFFARGHDYSWLIGIFFKGELGPDELEAMDDLYESAAAAGFIEEAAFRLINVLRCGDLDEEQVVAVWVGLLVLLADDRSMQHLFICAVMGATVKDLCAGLAGFAESIEDRETESLSSGPADRSEFLRFLHNHPLLAEQVVMKALGDLGPAVAAVMEDEVDIRVPLCAVLNGMLHMVRSEGSLKESGSKGLWNQIASFAARDRGAFYDSFRSALDEWLERNKEDDAAGLRDSMRALRDAVGSSSNRFWETAYLACYRHLLQAALKCRIPRSLAKALGCSTELTYEEWLGSCEDESELRRQLFAYADYLDAQGQSGAAHVRNVVQEHFGRAAVREGKKC